MWYYLLVQTPLNAPPKGELTLENAILSHEKFTSPESRYAALAQVLAKNFISIAQVDLRTGVAVVLKSDEDLELHGRELPWIDLLARYAQRKAYPEDRAAVLTLTREYIDAFLDKGHPTLSLEVRCIAARETYLWAQIDLSVVSAAERIVLITTRNIDEDRMLRSIVDKFVYQDMDYFVLLNAKNNSYTMFSGTRSTVPIPPSFGDDYTAEMQRYNALYLRPADCAATTANMQIPHVLAMLEQSDRYSFSTSGITADGTFRRTRVQFQYYDKAAGLVLLTRTDITQMFLEEQEKNRQLADALQNALHDALTGIHNQKGTESLVVKSLASLHAQAAAFLFIDVDNFKMVNDTLGHQVGDQLLQYLANAIREIAAEQSGIAGRIGGDEFLLYLPAVTSLEQIQHCARRICHIFNAMTDASVKALPISCSVGISTYAKDGTDYETLLRKADQALYTSKRYGKSRYHFYSEDLPAPK